MHEEKKNTSSTLLEVAGKTRPLEISRHNRKNNIKVDVNKTGGCGMNLSASG
jgi:hypothetical protein